MPRTRIIAEQVWPVGEYSDTLNQFNSNNTDKIVVTFTRVNWPGTNADTVAKIRVQWSDGLFGEWGLGGGQAFDRFGNPIGYSRVSIDVPEISDGNGGSVKRSVNSGTFTFTVYQQLTSAITAEAV